MIERSRFFGLVNTPLEPSPLRRLEGEQRNEKGRPVANRTARSSLAFAANQTRNRNDLSRRSPHVEHT